MFKKMFLLMLSLILVICFTACDSGIKFASNKENSSVLRIGYVGITPSSMTHFMGIFKAKYPSQEIVYVNMGINESGKTISYDEVTKSNITAEIMAGNGPDLIICKSGVAPFKDLYKAVKADLFEPLDSYLEQDESFNYEDYYEAAFEAGRFNDSLYVMPYSFSAPLYISSQEHLNENNIMYQEWDNAVDMADDMVKFIESNNSTNMHFINAYSFLFHDNFFYSIDGIIDTTNGMVNIDNGNVKQLLKAVKLLYQNETLLHPNSIGQNTLENTVFSYTASATSGLAQAIELDSMGLTPIILPIKDSGKIHAKLDIGMLINKNSVNKQAAYDFMRIMMDSNEYFDTAESYSVNKNNFDFVVEKQNYSGEVDNMKASDEIIKQYKEALDSIDTCVLNGGAYNQLFDYFVPYFNDEKSLDECIQTAQSKIESYISE